MVLNTRTNYRENADHKETNFYRNNFYRSYRIHIKLVSRNTIFYYSENDTINVALFMFSALFTVIQIMPYLNENEKFFLWFSICSPILVKSE